MAIMALMDRVVDHCKNACCTRGFKRLFDGSFGGQKDARLKLWPTGKAVRGSSSSVGCLQSRAKSLDTAVSRLLRRLVGGSHLFPIKTLRAVHTPIKLPGPLACQLCPSSHTSGFCKFTALVHSPSVH